MAVRTETFAPGGAKRCQEAIARATMQTPLTIERDPDAEGGYVLLGADGDPLGYITAKHWLARELEAGRRLLHLSVNGAPGSAATPPLSITVRVAVGDEGDAFAMPPMASAAAPRSYHVGIVGESFHQPAIGQCMSGDPVTLIHEPDNPHDPDAIAVVSETGDTLGHIARDHWLKDALLEERSGCSATIDVIHSTEKGLAVVLHVALIGDKIGRRR